MTDKKTEAQRGAKLRLWSYRKKAWSRRITEPGSKHRVPALPAVSTLGRAARNLLIIPNLQSSKCEVPVTIPSLDSFLPTAGKEILFISLGLFSPSLTPHKPCPGRRGNLLWLQRSVAGTHPTARAVAEYGVSHGGSLVLLENRNTERTSPSYAAALHFSSPYSMPSTLQDAEKKGNFSQLLQFPDGENWGPKGETSCWMPVASFPSGRNDEGEPSSINAHSSPWLTQCVCVCGGGHWSF